MRICPNCGAENDDNALKCVLCEFEFSDVPETENASGVVPDKSVQQETAEKQQKAAHQNVAADPSPSASKGKAKILIAALAALAVFAGGVVGGIFLMKDKEAAPSDNGTALSSATETVISNDTTDAATTSAAATTSSTSTTTEAAEAAKTVKEYPAADISKYQPYITALKDNINSGKYKGLYSVFEIGYALYDLNGDNTPELIVSAGNNDIYSIDNGTAVNLTPFWGGNMVNGILLYDSGNIGMTSISGNGEGGTTFYRYSRGKELEKVDSVSFALSATDTVYYHDGKEIPRDEYDKLIAANGKEISVSSTPVTDIAEINSLISASNAPKPSISAQLIVEQGLQGVSIYLNVSGDYSYYTYDSYEYGPNSSVTPSPSRGSSSDSQIYITGFDGGVSKVIVNVTPYNSNGVAGDMVSASYIRESSNTNAITSCTKYGKIYSPSGSKVDGLTKSYLIDGGSATYERHDLTDGWHIVAVNQYYDGSVYWYELYDADDGDYYGWVNQDNVSFY